MHGTSAGRGSHNGRGDEERDNGDEENIYKGDKEIQCLDAKEKGSRSTICGDIEEGWK